MTLFPSVPQCFDTVGWVIWPIKIVSDMNYNVFGGTLNPTLLRDVSGDTVSIKQVYQTTGFDIIGWVAGRTSGS